MISSLARSASLRSVVFACLTLFLPLALTAQDFDSRSDGSDGALDLSDRPAGRLIFDPRSFDPPLDPDGDGIYHFTSITVPEGVELVLEARKLDYAPVHWLASGAVRIDGVLDLRGAAGHAASERAYAEPGPGGFHGGLSARGPAAAARGLGPGGGNAGANISGASYGSQGGGAIRAPTYGNRFLLPLVGGSGGGGLREINGNRSGGGGGGGGAILIASAVSVTLDGTIDVSGGAGRTGGSGGAVRILAPIFAGSGAVLARGGGGGASAGGGQGRIRIESRDRSYTGSLVGVSSEVTLPPRPVFFPAPRPRVRLTRIAGTAVSARPTGSFEVPDVAISSDGPVEVEISVAQIPPGSVVQLLLLTEDSGDVTVETSPLVGNLASSTATASVEFRAGFSRVFLRATW